MSELFKNIEPKYRFRLDLPIAKQFLIKVKLKKNSNVF